VKEEVETCSSMEGEEMTRVKVEAVTCTKKVEAVNEWVGGGGELEDGEGGDRDGGCGELEDGGGSDGEGGDADGGGRDGESGGGDCE